MTGQSLPAHAARAWIDIDLGALVRNGAALRRRAGVPLLPMVKADAYGLGAVPVARALEQLEPWGFGVATVAEGAELRAAGIARPVVVFTPLLPRDLAAALAAGLTPTLFRPADIRAWAPSGRPWHLAIETGMNRAGVPWTQVGALAEVLRAHPPEGAFTHFHSADLDDGSRQLQERRLREAIAVMPARPPLVHAENSAALERAEPSPWNVVRPGVFLYGVGSGEGSQLAPEPVVSMRARVVDIHDLTEGETVSYGARYRAEGARRVATLAAGYADGYRRSLSLHGPVLVNGREVRVAGVVTMDMTMIDVTGVPCEVGDVATLIGRDGAHVLTVETVAHAARLSPYELLTGLRARLPRVYGGGAE